MEGTADREEAGGSSSRRGINLLPLKKRALNHQQHPLSAESSPEPEEIKLEEENGSVDGDESSVPSSTATPPEEPADHDPLSAAAVTAVSEHLKKFLEKAKWGVLPEASPAAPPPPPLVAEKLMGDAIRSYATATARPERAPRPVEKLMCDAIGGSAAAERTTEQQEESGFGAAVQRWLDGLRATRPFLLLKKTLEMSDVADNQSRLQVSCKGTGGRGGCAITHCLSPAEAKRVENKAVGLLVPAMDRNGVSDTLTLRFLTSNESYRFMSVGWKRFRERNGLVLGAGKRWTRDVELEVWGFRSHKLPRQPPLKEGKLEKVKDATGTETKDGGLELELDDHFHEDGGLGVILLHREHTKKRVKSEEGDKDEAGPSSLRPVPRGNCKRKQQQDKQRDDASEAVAQRAAALADAVAAMSKEEMDAEFGEVMSNAAIGLLMIAGVIPKEQGQEQEEEAVAAEEERPEDVKQEEEGHEPSSL